MTGWAFAESCPLIEKLNLRDCTETTDEGIKAIANGCTSLISLDLYKCRPSVRDLSIKHLALQCPLLQDIILEGCHQITNLSLTALAYTVDTFKKLILFLTRELPTNHSLNLHRDVQSSRM